MILLLRAYFLQFEDEKVVLDYECSLVEAWAKNRGCDSQIVFFTGISDYAIEGYEVGAVRYILKPVKEEVINELLDKIYADSQKQEEDYFATEVMVPMQR